MNVVKSLPWNGWVVRVFICALLCASGVVAGQSSLRQVTILHTSDLHATLLPLADGNGGLAQLATAIRRERATAASVLHLDGGDIVQGSPVSTIFKGLPVFEFANALGIDVAALGNHEFDYGFERIADFQKTARFPLIAANVVNAAGQMLTPPGYVIKEVGGVRLGIIGAVTQLTNDMVRPRHMGPWRAAPVVPVVTELARTLKRQVDVVLVLGHLDHAEDAEILERVPDVAFVVSGHNHGGRPTPLTVDGRFGVKVRSNGRDLGRLDLTVDTALDRVTAWSWKALPVTTVAYPADEGVAALVQKWEKEVSDIVDVPIGETAMQLDGERWRRLVEQAIRDELGADIVLRGDGGPRAAIPKGTILARHVWNAIPFDNELVVVAMKGSELPPEVTAGREIDPSRTYRIVSTDFFAQTQLASAKLVFEGLGQQLRDLVIDWIRKQKRLD